MNKGIWLLLGATAAAGGLLRSFYERDHFVVEETTFSSEKIKTPKTFVFLSDLHDKEFGEGNIRLTESIKRSQPDGILIGGDMMVAKHGICDLEPTKRLLAGLAPIAPVYYGNGNHEQRLERESDLYGDAYLQLRRLQEQYGVTYLQNASVNVGEDVVISEVDISQGYYKDFTPGPMEPSYLTRRLGEAHKERFQILLAHSPLFFHAYEAWGANLTFAGHFHGGTIRLPVLGGVMTPQFQFFKPCCAGTFGKDDRHMMVSRGLGTHSVNLRLGNLPQVMVIKLQSKIS